MRESVPDSMRPVQISKRDNLRPPLWVAALAAT